MFEIFKNMKNLIYILIFLPSLLFSQETKNMELVGVRNITCENNETINFEVEDGNILKVLNVTNSGNISSSDAYWTSLNEEYIYYTRSHGISWYLTNNFPFYLPNGIHTLTANGKSTVYCLEFKLTSP
jgi:hypothetical protein